MSKKSEIKNQEREKRRLFVREQIEKMQISALEKDLLRSKWGKDTFKSEADICKILNREGSI